MASQPAGGFRQRANYFEMRAWRAKNLEKRRRMLDNASFYRSLAAIIPLAPRGFKEPTYNDPNRFRNRADECRALADTLTSGECIARLTALAEMYERLALQQRQIAEG